MVEIFPDFVPDAVQRYYRLVWTEDSALSKHFTNAAKRLVTYPKMEGIFQTLDDQGTLDEDWRHIFDAMVWAVPFSAEQKKIDKKTISEFYKKLNKAIDRSEELGHLLCDLLDMSRKMPDLLSSGYKLNSAIDLLVESGRSSRLERVPYRFDTDRLDDASLLRIGGVTLTDLPDAGDFVGVINSELIKLTKDRQPYLDNSLFRSAQSSAVDNVRFLIAEIIKWNMARAKKRGQSSLLLREKHYINWVEVALLSEDYGFVSPRSIVKNAVKEMSKEFDRGLFLLE